MATSLKNGRMAELAEVAPSVLFIALWRVTDNLELSGWVGAALALGVLIVQRLLKVHPHPILLGINTHLMIITPLIVGLYRLGFDDLASFIESNSYSGVLVTIFVVGCALTLLSSRGFLGTDGSQTNSERRGSLILLGGSAAAIGWAGTQDNQGFIAVALPIIGLFFLRQVLLNKSPDPDSFE